MFRKFIIKPPEQTIWCITDSAKVIMSQITITFIILKNG